MCSSDLTRIRTGWTQTSHRRKTSRWLAMPTRFISSCRPDRTRPRPSAHFQFKAAALPNSKSRSCPDPARGDLYFILYFITSLRLYFVFVLTPASSRPRRTALSESAPPGQPPQPVPSPHRRPAPTAAIAPAAQAPPAAPQHPPQPPFADR